MPGFSFAAVGRLGLTSPPYRIKKKLPIHRYYDPLRLPTAYAATFVVVRLAYFARRYLHDTLLHSTVLCSLLCSSHRRIRVYPHSGREFYRLAGTPLTLLPHKETIGSLKFPGYPSEYMPCSKTPVVS